MNRLFFIFLLFVFNICSAQDKECINTDRPDQSDAVYIIPKGSLQIESGLLLSKFGSTVDDFYTTMIRYGLHQRIELRMLLNAEWKYSNLNYKNKGLDPLNISSKINLNKPQGIFPGVTLVGYISLPKISSNDFKQKKQQ